jgi:hypothetical protein
VVTFARSMRTLTFANFKGGSGKSTLGHAVACRADDLGYLVVALDTDPQGDLYRRLTNSLIRADERPPYRFGRGSAALYAPQAPPPINADVDLLIVDTRGQHDTPGPFDAIVVPVDGVDAVLNMNYTIGRALQEGVQRIIIVKNGTSEGGPSFKRTFEKLHESVSDHRISVCPIEIPRCDPIKRSSLTNRPAWMDAPRSAGGRAILSVCDFILEDLLGASRARGAGHER